MHVTREKHEREQPEMIRTGAGASRKPRQDAVRSAETVAQDGRQTTQGPPIPLGPRFAGLGPYPTRAGLLAGHGNLGTRRTGAKPTRSLAGKGAPSYRSPTPSRQKLSWLFPCVLLLLFKALRIDRELAEWPAAVAAWPLRFGDKWKSVPRPFDTSSRYSPGQT